MRLIRGQRVHGQSGTAMYSIPAYRHATDRGEAILDEDSKNTNESGHTLRPSQWRRWKAALREPGSHCAWHQLDSMLRFYDEFHQISTRMICKWFIEIIIKYVKLERGKNHTQDSNHLHLMAFEIWSVTLWWANPQTFDSKANFKQIS